MLLYYVDMLLRYVDMLFYYVVTYLISWCQNFFPLCDYFFTLCANIILLYLTSQWPRLQKLLLTLNARVKMADFYFSVHGAIRDLGLGDLYPIFIKHKVDSLETCGPLTDDQLINWKQSVSIPIFTTIRTYHQTPLQWRIQRGTERRPPP